MATSGAGFQYHPAVSPEFILGTLLEEGCYDYPQAYVDEFYITPNSPVAELPTTLMDLHNHECSAMPFDLSHWDFEGNYIP